MVAKGGCNTRRCKCISSNAKCNIKCKCKNCTNKGTCESSTANGIGSLPIQEEEMDDTDELLATSSESDDSMTEEELDIQLYVDNCIDEIIT